MAIYHCSAQVVSRGGGRSAVAAAAYRSATQIKNEHDGETHNYTFKQGVVYSEVMLPENAPEKYRDRAVLWNEIELSERANGQLAREYEFSIPVELPEKERVRFAQETVNDIFVSKGMIADFAIHEKETDGKENPHIHVMVPMRPLDKDGKWEQKSEQLYLCKNAKGEERAFTKTELAEPGSAEWKKQHRYSKGGDPKAKKIYLSEYDLANPKYKGYERVKNDRQPKTEKYGRKNPTIEYWNSKDFLMYVRENVAIKINAELERMGLAQRVDYRSLKDQGIDREPTTHEGVAARAMERRGEMSDRCEINREIKQNNEARAQITGEIGELQYRIDEIDADIKWQTLHENIAAVASDAEAHVFDKVVQMQLFDKLNEVEKAAEKTYAEQEGKNYHAEQKIIIDGEPASWQIYHRTKALFDARRAKEEISKNIAFIDAVPVIKEYEYGKIDVQAINEDYRADRAEDGSVRIVQRGELERDVIRDTKISDKWISGLIDTSRLERLIEEQKATEKRKEPPHDEYAATILRIRENFENLRFIERHDICSIADVHQKIEILDTQRGACMHKLFEAGEMLRKLESENGGKGLWEYREKMRELQTALWSITSELDAYKRCASVLERIDRDQERRDVSVPSPMLHEGFDQSPQNPLPATQTSHEKRETLQKVENASAAPHNSQHRTNIPPGSQDTPAGQISRPAARSNALEGERTKPVAFDAAAVARKLEEHRAAFVKATLQAGERTVYYANPIYRQQAAKITECVNYIKDYNTSIDGLKATMANLRFFKAKEKKELQHKIDYFEGLRREREAELKALGVSDLSRADETIKAKTALAEQEQAKARAAQENVGAADRAEAAKAAFLDLAKNVPEDKKADVLDLMKNSREKGDGQMTEARYKAIIAAQRQLDAALKPVDPAKEDRQKVKTIARMRSE